jgi:hypothetical protein
LNNQLIFYSVNDKNPEHLELSSLRIRRDNWAVCHLAHHPRLQLNGKLSGERAALRKTDKRKNADVSGKKIGLDRQERTHRRLRFQRSQN